MVKTLGAERLIDYNKDDYSKRNTRFDIVFDAVGKTTKLKAKKILKPGGTFVSIKMLTKEKSKHLNLIKILAEEGKLKPFIDKSFKLDDIIKAHEYVETGRKRGNVTINILK